jgi:tRNA-Thr(GGU) m(6)t(6)A37 methyltransferase TsaA
MTDSLEDPSLRIIGAVRSQLTDRARAPKQGRDGAPSGRLEILEAFRPGLLRLAAGQQVLILTWLHQADRAMLEVHPRDDVRNPLTGVFATRSADRPNPIGLHRVTILKIEENGCLIVEPLEAIDGTPVIDIKPVLDPAVDS